MDYIPIIFNENYKSNGKLMEKDSLYIKIWDENIKNCGTIDCGCEIVKIESPHVTLKLCKIHEKEVWDHNAIFKNISISPMIDNSEKFEAIHLAAIGSKTFNVKNES